MSTKLLQEVKENNQDFEWYPTSIEILKQVNKSIKKDIDDYSNECGFSILDIGAGNGKVFEVLENLSVKGKDKYTRKRDIEKFAIEKSQILMNYYSSDITVVGTDFLSQTLLDKKVDIIFCNPPYSDYENWTKKILSESNCKYIYLVIPSRWQENKKITSLINKRNFKQEIIFSYDFINSEDRKARAKVDVVKLSLDKYDKNDPFDIWFDDNFKIEIEDNDKSSYEVSADKQETLHNQLTSKINLIENLEELYTEDFTKLLNNYKSLEKMDGGLLKELNVDLESLKIGLKEKIKGLKYLYWQEFFDNFFEIFLLYWLG